jgi:hypothetical protein
MLNSIGEMPLVKIYSLDGHMWTVWPDGRIDGFPPGVFVINHAQEIDCRLRNEVCIDVS